MKSSWRFKGDEDGKWKRDTEQLFGNSGGKIENKADTQKALGVIQTQGDVRQLH